MAVQVEHQALSGGPLDVLDEVLKESLLKLESHPKLEPLANQIRGVQANIRLPMRVAVVGLVKAGKSTFLNAIIGQKLAGTGSTETTFNVSHFQYGEIPRARPVRPDGSEGGWIDLSELSSLADRSPMKREGAHDIRYIDVYLKNEGLKSLELIDTPGFDSLIGEDSENAMTFLTNVTLEYAMNADAVLYLFNKGVSESDIDAIAGILQKCHMTPLSAIGILTKIDYPYRTEPVFEAAEHKVAKLNASPKLSRLLYTVKPVCAILAEGANALTDQDFELLRSIAALDEEEREDLLSAAQSIKDPELSPHIAVEGREILFRLLGPFGLNEAVRMISSGSTPSLEVLKHALISQSGIPEIKELIGRHFRYRSDSIKAISACNRLMDWWLAHRSEFSGKDLEAGSKLMERCEQFCDSELSQGFAELRGLKLAYSMPRGLEMDMAEIRRLLGEEGRSVYQRLGETKGTDFGDMRAQALSAHWRWKAKEAGWSADDSHAPLCEIVVRTYERIIDRLQLLELLKKKMGMLEQEINKTGDLS